MLSNFDISDIAIKEICINDFRGVFCKNQVIVPITSKGKPKLCGVKINGFFFIEVGEYRRGGLKRHEVLFLQK